MINRIKFFIIIIFISFSEFVSSADGFNQTAPEGTHSQMTGTKQNDKMVGLKETLAYHNIR